MLRRNLLLAMTLVSFGVFSLGSTLGKSTAPHLNATPKGRLVLSFHPYTGPGHETMPVEVLIFDVVVGYDSMWVREWRLKNHSEKAVVRIRKSLFIYSEEAPDTLLLRSSTKGLEDVLGVQISPGQEWPEGTCSPKALSCQDSYAMPSADKLLKPLFKEGAPEGKYRLALGIDKVWFADGTIWELETANDK